MALFTASLYLLCLVFLLGSAVFIYSRAPQSKLNQYYALLALALLAWVGTLFIFDSLPEGRTLLLVGRANFAAAALVATTSCWFVMELAGRRLPARAKRILWLETAVLTALSFGTPLVDRAETVVHGQHITDYGPLFSLYSLHVIAFLAGAVIIAFQALPKASPRTRPQLRLVGTGILATALIGVTTNIVLPYGVGDFRFINIGPLSTILFLGAILYAVFAAHLFSIRVLIRIAFVYASLITLTMELYSLALSFLAKLLPLGDTAERAYAATAIALIVNAFTQQAVRHWLDRLIDHTTHPKSIHPASMHLRSIHSRPERLRPTHARFDPSSRRLGD